MQNDMCITVRVGVDEFPFFECQHFQRLGVVGIESLHLLQHNDGILADGVGLVVMRNDFHRVEVVMRCTFIV